jgi:hypothetical protein
MCLRITCAEMRVFSSWCGGNALLQEPNCGRNPHVGLSSIAESGIWVSRAPGEDGAWAVRLAESELY